jgi:hypothetical protein
MPASTPNYGLPFPLPDDSVDVPRDVQALATKIDGLAGLAPVTFPFKRLGPYDDFASWGVQPQRDYYVPHGLGATPTWAIATASNGTSTAQPNDPVVATIKGMDATNVIVTCRFVSGGNANLPGVYVYVLVAIP